MEDIVRKARNVPDFWSGDNPVGRCSVKRTLKATGNKRLKLKYDVPLSNFAFDLDFRRYNPVLIGAAVSIGGAAIFGVISGH